VIASFSNLLFGKSFAIQTPVLSLWTNSFF
jgi:hypothetical protein